MPNGLADRWKKVQRETQARAFDEIADQIEAGLLRISGDATPDEVHERLRTRAANTRLGLDRHQRRRVPRPEMTPDD